MGKSQIALQSSPSLQANRSHPHLATSYDNLSVIYGDLSQYIQYQLKCIEIRETDLACSYHNLSQMYINLGMYADAVVREGIRGKVMDGNHPDLAKTYSNQAYIHIGKYSQALECIHIQDWIVSRRSIDI